MTRGKRNPLHTDFPLRLRRQRQALDIAPRRLAEQAGLGNDVAGYLESGERVPRLETVARLAAALGVSASWLAYGVEPEPPGGIEGATLGQRLSAVRTTRGLSQVELGERAELSGQALGRIERDRHAADIATVERLADALEVSPGWLAYGVERAAEGPV